MTRRFLRQRRFTSRTVSGPAIDASEIQRPRYGIVATHLPIKGPPTGSIATSGGFSASVFTRSPVKRLTVTSAPTSRQNAPFASEATCATTLQPKTCFASWIAAMPSPPSPPLMKNVSPLRISPTSFRLR